MSHSRTMSRIMEHSHRFYTYCGILMLVSEIWKQWTLTFILNNGSYNWWYFPFQLCSIPMYVCLAIGLLNSSFVSRHLPSIGAHGTHISALLSAFLMNFGLVGGIFTFFDTSGLHYGYLPLTIHSYVWHILLIVIGCYSGLDHASDHSVRGYTFSVILYLVCCGAATVFNLAFYRFGSINMFYISPHYYMHQKVFRHITDTFGNGYGIASYIAATTAGAGLFHLFWNQLYKLKSR